MAITVAEARQTSQTEDLIARFEAVLRRIDTTDSIMQKVVEEIRAEGLENIQDFDPTEPLHVIDCSEGHEAIDDLIVSYVKLAHAKRKAKAAEKAMEIADKRVDLDKNQMNSVISDHYCLDPSGEGWLIRPFHRTVVAHKEKEENEQESFTREEILNVLESIGDFLSGYGGEQGLRQLIRAGAVPKELDPALAQGEAIASFVNDLIQWLEVSGSGGLELARQAATDADFAMNLVKHHEVFYKPLGFLALLRVKVSVRRDVD